jgi:hypothetical protein
MSIFVRATILCDGTYEGHECLSADADHPSIAEAKRHCIMAGWVFQRNKAYCPECAEERGL